MPELEQTRNQLQFGRARRILIPHEPSVGCGAGAFGLYGMTRRREIFSAKGYVKVIERGVWQITPAGRSHIAAAA
jgi:hypothetical protein